MNKILEVKHVSASYTTQGGAFSRDKVQIVLHDVSFDLYEGEALGLVGESGSGKTTIARAILGFLPRYEGEIIHHSKRPQLIFQDPYRKIPPYRGDAGECRSFGRIYEQTPVRAFRRTETACFHRSSPDRAAAACDRGRTGFRPGCDHPGTDPAAA